MEHSQLEIENTSNECIFLSKEKKIICVHAQTALKLK